MDWWVLWIGLAVVLFIVELTTTDLVAVWFALAALAMGIVTAIFDELHVVWQVVIFVALSTLLVILTRRFVRKLLQRRKDQETNLELVVNHTAMVVEDIDNDREAGAIKINGLIWSARSADGEKIDKETLVTVREIKGNKAIVVKKEEQEA
ncbi:MAG: NfeD family protein [Clostridia bacterium]|nr:NfeD family protein [Clostridia bacterium]